MEKSLYLKCDESDIAKYVIFSGDPWRVDVVKKYLDDVKHIAFSREYNTYTGYYKGVRVTISSTGIGAPSAAIAMEEMYNCGMEVALRMGTVMSLKDNLLGDYIVPVGSIREESTSKTYVQSTYPAIADFDLVKTINKTIKEHHQHVDNGLNATLDGFYSQMHMSKLAKERNIDVYKVFEKYKKLGVSGIDMESACMMVVGRLMNVKTASLTLVTVLENLKEYLKGKEREDKEEELCLIALDSIYKYDKEVNKL
ncbi:nucleoside phosphorylase [Candidatus Izemoplasma sp. B36]|uniref:nucleoside phosphorylase n=1 Tax=Candidatus Izemoplasma sp. B36 TaxID=3242468 RepID=UPI003555F5FA